MITKILFTALIVVAALTFVRFQNSRQQQRRAAAEQQRAGRGKAMLFALLGVALTLALSGVAYYWHWQEQQRTVVVRVVNGHTGAEQAYRVYQRDLDGRRFRTVEGKWISLSSAERMEVSEER
ncbi:MAG: hypothetical protein ACQETD_12210 [Pseudomonadota bacterium]